METTKTAVFAAALVCNASVACMFAMPAMAAPKIRNFKVVEYIESSGTQCINTGFSPIVTNVCLEMTYRFVSLPADGSRKYVFGTCQDDSRNVRFQYAVGSAGKCAFGFGSGWISDATVDSFDTNTVHTVVCSNGVFSLDGTVVKDLSSSAFTKPITAAPVYLFANNNKGLCNPDYNPSMRLYSCRIWNNGMLVRDFVPALDGNSTACLCDILGGRFYYNVGEGVFTAGEVLREVSQTYMTASYVETDRTAFIDTEYVPNKDTRIELDFAFTRELSTKTYVLGAYGESSSGRFMFSYGPASTGCFLGYGADYQTDVPGLDYSAGRHVMKYIPGEGFYFDGDRVESASVVLTNWSGTSRNLFLGTCNRNGDSVNADYNSPIRIYSCKIWEGDELKRDLAPKRRTSDQKNGLYDNVTESFLAYYGDGVDFTASMPGFGLLVR